MLQSRIYKSQIILYMTKVHNYIENKYLTKNTENPKGNFKTDWSLLSTGKWPQLSTSKRDQLL